MSDIATFPTAGELGRRAVDWSRVTWVHEMPDGFAAIHFDATIGGGMLKMNDWCGVGVTYDEAIRQWRSWKRSTGTGKADSIVRAAWDFLRGEP